MSIDGELFSICGSLMTLALWLGKSKDKKPSLNFLTNSESSAINGSTGE